MKKTLLFALACALLAGCPNPTKFEGEAKFPQGSTGCRKTCAADDLVMTGFVYSGEFATSCVCGPASTAAPGASASTVAPSAGVVVQTEAAAAAAAAASAQQLQMQQQLARQQSYR